MAHHTNSVCLDDDEFLNQDLSGMIVVDAWDEKDEMSKKQSVEKHSATFNQKNRDKNRRRFFGSSQTKDKINSLKSESHEICVSNSNYKDTFSGEEKWEMLKDNGGENTGKLKLVESALPPGTEMDFDIQTMSNMVVDGANFDLSTHPANRSNGQEYRQSSGRLKSPTGYSSRYDLHPAHSRPIPPNHLNSEWRSGEEEHGRSREMSPSEHIRRYSLNYLQKLKTIPSKVDDRRQNPPRHFLEELAEILEKEDKKKKIAARKKRQAWQASNPQQRILAPGSNIRMTLLQRPIYSQGFNVQNQVTGMRFPTDPRYIPSQGVNPQSVIGTPASNMGMMLGPGSIQSYDLQHQMVTPTFGMGMTSEPRPFQNQMFSLGSGTGMAPRLETVRPQEVVHENRLITPAKMTSSLSTTVPQNHILTPVSSKGIISGASFNGSQAVTTQNTIASAINMRLTSATKMRMAAATRSIELANQVLQPSPVNLASQYDESFFIGSNETAPVSKRHLFPSVPVQDDFKSNSFMKMFNTNTKASTNKGVGVSQNHTTIENQIEEDKKTVTELSQDIAISVRDHSSESTKFKGADNAKINTGSRFLSNQPFYLQTIQKPSSLDTMRTELDSATDDSFFVEDYLEVSSPEVDQSLPAKDIESITSKQTLEKVKLPKATTSSPLWIVKSQTKPKSEPVKNNLSFGKWNAKVADQPIRIQLKNCFSKKKKTTFLSVASSSHSTRNVSEQTDKINNEHEIPYVKENSPLLQENYPPPPPIVIPPPPLVIPPPPLVIPPPPPLVIPPPELLKPPPAPIISDCFSYKSKNRKRRRKNKN